MATVHIVAVIVAALAALMVLAVFARWRPSSSALMVQREGFSTASYVSRDNTQSLPGIHAAVNTRAPGSLISSKMYTSDDFSRNRQPFEDDVRASIGKHCTHLHEHASSEHAHTTAVTAYSVNVHCTLPQPRLSPVRARVVFSYVNNRKKFVIITTTTPPLKRLATNARVLTAEIPEIRAHRVNSDISIDSVQIFLADARVTLEPGCHVRIPGGCTRQKRHSYGAAYGSSWLRDTWGERHSNAKNDATACLVKRKRDYNSWCGVDDTEMEWVGTAVAASRSEALLVEAVTVMRHSPGDDTDQGDPDHTFQGLFVPFALFQHTPAIDPLCGQVKNRCGVRQQLAGGLYSRRPVNSSVVMSMGKFKKSATMWATQTRVFRARLTLMGNDGTYPKRLRLLFFTEPKYQSRDMKMADVVALALADGYTLAFNEATRQYEPRCCMVDLDVGGKGVGQLFEFFVNLLAAAGDTLHFIPLLDETDQTLEKDRYAAEVRTGAAARLPSLANLSLHLIPNHPTDQNKEFRALPSAGNSIETAVYLYEQTYALAHPEPSAAAPHTINIPRTLCQKMTPLAWQQRRSTVLDLLHLLCPKEAQTGCTRTNLTSYFCGDGSRGGGERCAPDAEGMAHCIHAGQGLSVQGHFICRTADSAAANASDILVETTVKFKSGDDLTFRIRRNAAVISVLGATASEPDAAAAHSVEIPVIRNSAEVLYCFTIFKGTTSIWVSTNQGAETQNSAALSALRLPPLDHYPPIHGVMHMASPPIDMVACTLYTDIPQLPRDTDLERSDQVAVLLRDVRASAAPHMFQDSMGGANVVMTLNRPVNTKHMALTIVLHTHLLKYTQAREPCSNGVLRFDDRGELVVAAFATVEIVLVLDNPSDRSANCTPSSRHLKLRINGATVAENLLKSAIVHNPTKEKNNYGMVHLLITHPGIRQVNKKYQGRICVQIANTWGDSQGAQETRVVNSVSYDIPSIDYDKVTLNSWCVVNAVQDGRVLPHQCGDDDFTPQYPHASVTTLQDEATQLTQQPDVNLLQRIKQPRSTDEHQYDLGIHS